ncbi:MAG: DUF4980 domain-containing protein, partial [Muribaculaceae bacterium]|nr:DUF4980 domain-containing protein [Muribaculaceae bacterium]
MKITLKATVAAMVLLPVSVNAADGVDIEHLGTNNTLVRVTGDSKYLILPVQESNDDARINVLVDGKLDRTINVRLAKSKVDYYVPFDVEPYKGHSLALTVTTSQGRNSVREAKDDACWKNICMADT